MNRKAILALLLISGAVATPAYANFFHNPYLGINLNIGSAPNPTPEDIRASRLPIIVQDDAAPTPPVADASKSDAKPAAPVAQAQPNAKIGEVASATAAR